MSVDANLNLPIAQRLSSDPRSTIQALERFNRIAESSVSSSSATATTAKLDYAPTALQQIWRATKSNLQQTLPHAFESLALCPMNATALAC